MSSDILRMLELNQLIFSTVAMAAATVVLNSAENQLEEQRKLRRWRLTMARLKRRRLSTARHRYRYWYCEKCEDRPLVERMGLR